MTHIVRTVACRSQWRACGQADAARPTRVQNSSWSFSKGSDDDDDDDGAFAVVELKILESAWFTKKAPQKLAQNKKRWFQMNTDEIRCGAGRPLSACKPRNPCNSCKPHATRALLALVLVR